MIFNLMDSDFTANIGAAIMVKSSFGPALDVAALAEFVNNTDARDSEHYRRGYDVMFPLAFYRCGFHPETHLRHFDNTTLLPSYVRPTRLQAFPVALQLHHSVEWLIAMCLRCTVLLQRRPVLVSFKGARHELPEFHPAFPRNRLSLIHNGRDVIIATYCAFETIECKDGTRTVLTTGKRDYIESCMNDTKYSNSVDYRELITHSQFTLIVPGEGTHSYRLLEAMSVGPTPFSQVDHGVTLLRCCFVSRRRAPFLSFLVRRPCHSSSPSHGTRSP